MGSPGWHVLTRWGENAQEVPLPRGPVLKGGPGMPDQLSPYLRFSGQARGAMEFYRTIFGGTLTAMTFGEFGASDSADAQLIIHSVLRTPGGLTLMAADSGPGGPPGATVAVMVRGEDEARMRAYWDQLRVDGSVAVPFVAQRWGGLFGQCTDKFGVDWMVMVDAPGGPSRPPTL